ncbi:MULTISPECIES: NUDIX domain-containing protein [unclassified Pseudomonas]|uniref:NUDIX domain-containing protein n=1 Tax=unclassified Pseudomonas TaxID=196821 RepID=UPI000BD7F783|nr:MULTISPECIES: NUDIX domain-containing protein [unclassified Pseudomonas]PVZ19463.1 8-oxo-dGTP diphosphatase [Pseudomonas sp. URIL14HWK12:I12]PVZ22952.1 8-oxo-dGTP diphosphatase [Pseudomonas sp. URIL14HWK12:I10]PVZ37418.1 8-oxo-dGTP diphosphatase [Pseudomonas sp. URIL14HWK12:I11]SNZ14737.1 8-oxo-dGTP diphosphatase [Pseudomonas sp. URIL14HWK12:I9]
MAQTTKHRATILCWQGDRLLLVRKPKSKWNLPGGRVEARETPEQAAIRELAEETGINAGALGFIDQRAVKSTQHYVFETHIAPSERAVALNEIADCRWFSRHELLEEPLNKEAKVLLGFAV